MRKPSIRILQDFARPYFTSRCPIVRWKKMGYGCTGKAGLNKDVIYLSPMMDLNFNKIRIAGRLYRLKDRMKLKEGEQYFFTLTHEIGHFKIKKKPPKEWNILVKKRLGITIENLKDENKCRRNFGDKPLTAKEEKEYVCNDLSGNVKLVRRKGESNSHYLGRYEDFRSWLMGDYASEHILVEKWARKEFKKRRKEIKEILLNI